MAAVHCDLPTLHRPIVDDYNIERAESFESFTPIPKPPHKPEFKQLSKSRATYPCASNWISNQSVLSSTNESLPPILTESNWKAIRAGGYLGPRPDHYDYSRSYTDLMSKHAYRYPNPGEPVKRAGSVGGTWRHIKEAVGYGPGRLMWIDGVITMYDDSGLNFIHNRNSSENHYQNRHDYHYQTVSASGLKANVEQQEQPSWYKHKMPQLNFTANKPTDKTYEASKKYKEFYSLQRSYQ